MDMFNLLLAVLALYGVWLAASPWVAWQQANRLRVLEGQVRRLIEARERLDRDAVPDTPAHPVPKPPAPERFAAPAMPPAPPMKPAPVWSPPKAAQSYRPDSAAPQRSEADAAQTSPSEAAARDGAGANPFETLLASRWMVWTGAVALALGGVFLVRYSIEQGLLGPVQRMFCGLLLGLGLSFAGEWLRRRPLLRPLASLRPEYVPAAVAGAGLASLFATVWAAHALYGLIGPLPAFVIMAAIAGASIVLALLHGAAFALFGALAGYLVPVLVSSANPSPWGLFPYLALLTGACLLLVRDRGWTWLSWVAMTAALLWALAWIAVLGRAGDIPVVGSFLIVLAGLAVLTRRTIAAPPPPLTSPRAWFAGLFAGEPFVHASLTAIATLMLIAAAAGDFSSSALLVSGALVAVLLALALRLPTIEGSSPIAALFTLALIATWRADLPGLSMLARDGRLTGGGSLVPDTMAGFAAVAAAFGLLFALTGFAALWRARTPALWAVLSAAVPLLLTVLVYAGAGGFERSASWAALGLGQAMFALLAASHVRRHGGQGGRGALAVYAVAVCTALALAAAMILREAWLTVALAAMLPALTWVHRRLDLAPLRWVAALIVPAVLVRLLFNPALLHYGQDGSQIAWVFYGYGLPAVAFLAAAYLFGGRRDDRLVLHLQGGAVALAVALQVVATRLLAAGGLFAPMELGEFAIHAVAWLAAALVFARSARGNGHPVLHGSAALLFLAALLCIAAGPLLFANPLFSHIPVGSWPILNLLAPAYAMPAALMVLLAREQERQKVREFAALAWGAALVLTLAYVTLEIRHAFHGTHLNRGGIVDAELYAYSVGWLTFGLGLLAGGLVSSRAALRYASLALICAVAAKAFLWDMAGLTGVFRALTFLGLGAVLIGIGFLYQRFVFRRVAPGADAD